MLAASRHTASITRGEAPSRFSLADRRTSCGRPSSAASVSSGLPASYGVTASTAARQSFRTGRIVRRSAAGATDAPPRSKSASVLTLIAARWYARRRHAARDLSSGPARRGRGSARRGPAPPAAGLFRGALTEGLDALKQRHADGASGEDLVRTHA